MTLGEVLTVQVAEALGTFHAEHDWDERAWVNQGRRRECGDHDEQGVGAPHYDTDWSATGPLIERFAIAIEPTCNIEWRAGWTNGKYDHIDEEWWDCNARGKTPLEAVCRLILDLKAQGKLS